MKILFTASQRGKKEFGKYYKRICDEIKKTGHTIIEDDLLKVSTDEFYKKLNLGGRKANIEFYEQKIDDLHKSDIVILESSLHSLSIGFLVEKSLELNKPTVVLYYKDNEPYFLEGANDEKLILRSYNERNLAKILSEAINAARERRDKRFNFFIGPKILSYLKQRSKLFGVTMASYVRRLIIEDMRKAG